MRAKGANIAFATSIAHSSGFSETNGVMRVDGGATGLGTYVAAMREVAVEMAHEQGLSLARLWKEDEILTRLRLSIHRMESR